VVVELQFSVIISDQAKR